MRNREHEKMTELGKITEFWITNVPSSEHSSLFDIKDPEAWGGVMASVP